ncbi:MAG: metallophosphoesterase [Bacteroides sp.]|nr:metallophosphoesterase [Eubacterium sp.]MCM1417451.1 metallophosphoesterase [Roseburia sp.]MCM1461631.1 metallophosphoesterase [Bacteroides sp.]
MKIIVISDTHDNFEAMERIVSDNRSADLFIHLGDGEREYEDVRALYPDRAFLMLRGNNDWGDYPITHVFSLGGYRFFLTHGSQYMRGYLYNSLAASATANDCMLALFGHTHVPFNETVGGVRLFNPGSPTLPRGRSDPSYGVITIEKDGTIDLRHEKYTAD